MMSQKQWFVLLCIYLSYVLAGALVFYAVEKEKESLKLEKDRELKFTIEDLIHKHYVPSEEHTQQEIFHKIFSYCEKPVAGNVPENLSNVRWTFYQSLFFVISVISTIGCGDLTPSTPFTRAFMIVYGVIGIPLNGILVITLGDFFAKNFLKVYRRWKSLRVEYALATLGLIGQIIQYSLPGVMLFIILPSVILVLYEGWTYDLAIEFAFATLTTIGGGNVVPGTRENGHGQFWYTVYKVYLLVWIIVGMGYLAMVFNFITNGLRSKRMHALERRIAQNIKKTNRKIRQELRSLLNEYLLMRVKPVYRVRRVNVVSKCERRHSCPNLSLNQQEEFITIRKRAVSELIQPTLGVLPRIQSDSDLQGIDKTQMFIPKANEYDSNQLLLRVAHALGNDDSSDCGSNRLDDINLYSDNGRLKSSWSISNRKLSMVPREMMRPRAASDTRNDKCAIHTRLETRGIQERCEQETYGKIRNRSLPPASDSQNIFMRLRNTFAHPKEDERSIVEDIESQVSTEPVEQDEKQRQPSALSVMDKDKLLEETSIADFLRALTIVDFSEVSRQPRKFNVNHPSPLLRVRRLPITPTTSSRKISLIPDLPTGETKERRFSLHPVSTLTKHREDLRSPLLWSVSVESNTTCRSSASGNNSKFNPTATNAL